MVAGTVQRLRDARSITAVLGGRRQRAGPLLVLHVRERAGDPVRVAVVASRRVGTAVRRNRAKRLLREAAGRARWKAGTDAVLVARSACADSGLTEVSEQLTRLGQQLGVIIPEREGP